MVINKLLNEVSIQKIWKKFTQHEEIMEDKQKQINELDDKFGGVRFGYDSNGYPGFYAKNGDGADSVIPFSGEVNLAAMTPATATADMITEGFTAWVNGELLIGTRPIGAKVLSGTVSVSAYRQVSTTATHVNFTQEFDTVPTISVSKGSEWGAASGGSSNNIKYAGVNNVTTKGFDLMWYSSGNTGANGDWRYCYFNWTAKAQ